MSVLLRIAYDGSEFHGFARQPGIRTVQGELDRAISALHGREILCRGASRTDAGVHALGQLVAFEPLLKIPVHGQVLALNAKLPRDVSVLAAWEESGTAPVEPRFGNAGKHYRYTLVRSKVDDPLADRTRWRVYSELDLQALREAAARFIGEHDFAGFRAADCQAAGTKRRVTHVGISTGPGCQQRGGYADYEQLFVERRAPDTGLSHLQIDIDIHGEAFLKNMVRIMVGTLLEVARGRQAPEWVSELLALGDRTRSGPTAPARGLTLVEVFWPGRGRPAMDQRTRLGSNPAKGQTPSRG